MKRNLKIPGLFLFLIVLSSCCYAQPVRVVSTKKDTAEKKQEAFHLLQDVWRFREKMKIKELELRTVSALNTIDSLQYGKDSLIANFYNPERMLLKKIVQKFYVPKRIHDDSTVYFYNERGLLEYSEMWEIYPKPTVAGQREFPYERIKSTCRRYEYDAQGRVVRYLGSFPTPRMMEFVYTYDSSGKRSTTARNIHPIEYWEERKH